MKKQNKFALSILTVSLFAATSAMATGNDSPFAPPLHLSNAGAMESRTVTSVEKNDLTAEWQKKNKYGTIPLKATKGSQRKGDKRCR